MLIIFTCSSYSCGEGVGRGGTVGHVEEGEAPPRVVGARVLGAEALHVLVGADGLLDGRVLTGQPTPVLHTAVQTGVDLVHTQQMYTYMYSIYIHIYMYMYRHNHTLNTKHLTATSLELVALDLRG